MISWKYSSVSLHSGFQGANTAQKLASKRPWTAGVSRTRTSTSNPSLPAQPPPSGPVLHPQFHTKSAPTDILSGSLPGYSTARQGARSMGDTAVLGPPLTDCCQTSQGNSRVLFLTAASSRPIPGWGLSPVFVCTSLVGLKTREDKVLIRGQVKTTSLLVLVSKLKIYMRSVYIMRLYRTIQEEREKFLSVQAKKWKLKKRCV